MPALDDAALATDPARAGAVARALDQLAGPGALLTGTDRVHVAGLARRAWDGEDVHVGSPMEQAALWVAADAEGIDESGIASLEASGLNRLAFLEVAGVVARLSTIDWYARGVGAESPALPTASTDPPTAHVSARAQITDAWVPMVGPSSAPRTLDALPFEGDALRDLHEPTYLAMTDIETWDLADALTRSQIEVVATRVSYLNECFY